MPFVDLPASTPTAYLRGGGTRTPERAVPPLVLCMTVGQIRPTTAGPWRMSPCAAAAFVALQADLAQLGVEPIRVTDVYRDQRAQADARRAYEAWVAAGRPSTPGPGMKTAFVAKPNESNHGWGGSIDIDVEALQMPGVPRGSSRALAAFWRVAADNGFTPIIADPNPWQSECWHFDHLGPLRSVRNLAQTHGSVGYAYAARVGCALQGTLVSTAEIRDTALATVQALLALGGIWPGPIDGIMGPSTRAGLAMAGVQVARGVPPMTLYSELIKAGVGTAELAEL